MSPVSPVFHTVVIVSIGPQSSLRQKLWSIILDVHFGRQSAKNFHLVFLPTLVLRPILQYEILEKLMTYIVVYRLEVFYVFFVKKLEGAIQKTLQRSCHLVV